MSVKLPLKNNQSYKETFLRVEVSVLNSKAMIPLKTESQATNLKISRDSMLAYSMATAAGRSLTCAEKTFTSILMNF